MGNCCFQPASSSERGTGGESCRTRPQAGHPVPTVLVRHAAARRRLGPPAHLSASHPDHLRSCVPIFLAVPWKGTPGHPEQASPGARVRLHRAALPPCSSAGESEGNPDPLPHSTVPPWFLPQPGVRHSPARDDPSSEDCGPGPMKTLPARSPGAQPPREHGLQKTGLLQSQLGASAGFARVTKPPRRGFQSCEVG